MGDSMYFMTEGTVKIVMKQMETGIVYNQYYLNKKSYFGEVSVLTQCLRTSDAIAIDFCILECFTRSSFIHLQ